MNDGKKFETEVREILKLQGWNVSQEVLILTKKVDSLIEKADEFGRPSKFALECKDYASTVTKEQLVNIYSDYLPLIENKAINGLLIVTRNGVSPVALTYIDKLDRLRHLSFDDLIDKIIGFAPYVKGLVDEYENDGLDVTYVKQDFITREKNIGNELERELIKWTFDDSKKYHIAILASYGMGKSTLAKRFAFLLSNRHILDSSSRIPILIKLEDIADEQSLEGLLGKHFTSFSPVQNYNFRSFMKLNSIGKFVIILDGFDEMKKTISFEHLRYNFNQLKRLIGPKSKVLILGRPNVFLSEEEYLEIIHGERRVGKNLKKIPDSPSFKEYNLLPFNKGQIIDFIKKHYSRLERKNVGLMDEVVKFKHKLLNSIIARPVQLKMLIDVLPYYDGTFDTLTTTVLYSEFIDLVIRREQDKHSRTRFTLKQRRDFASKLAYWMWTNNLSQGVKYEAIPDELFSEYKYFNDDIPLIDIKRDFLTACFLEKKEPQGFFFPHRSFQEFLVAENLYKRVLDKDTDLYQLGFISQDTVNFFIELISLREVQKWHHLIFDISEKTNYSRDFLSFFHQTCLHFGIRIIKKDMNYLKRRPKLKKSSL